MRTTVELPAALYERLVELSGERGASVSTVLTEVATRGLDRLDAPSVVRPDPRTGFPVIALGRVVTQEEVDAFLDEE